MNRVETLILFGVGFGSGYFFREILDSLGIFIFRCSEVM